MAFATLKYVFWFIGGVLLLAWGSYIVAVWRRLQADRVDPLALLIKELFKQFWLSLLLVILPTTLIILLGFLAGTRFSMVLYVVISALTISGIALASWYFWPKEQAESNLFDLLPLPDVEWPLFEDERDHRIRTWVKEKANSLKADPPEFEGAIFGKLAIEISQEVAQAYEKKTILSVSVNELLEGLERTAADLKILSNNIPLAGHLTLADIERQIDFTIRRGTLLYISLFLILSLVNPGNLVRVVVILAQDKSPWKHLLTELRGWVYAHYVQRLGYHMILIYSERQPPPSGSLQRSIDRLKESRVKELQKQKLGMLTLLSLFGMVLYLTLQITNAVLVFGFVGLVVDLLLLVILALGVWGLRDGRRWRLFWQALIPQWPEEVPPEGERERKAREAIDLVHFHHRYPPEINSLEEAKLLFNYYGNLVYEVWEACYMAYSHPDEEEKQRASRELYLPQAFAGIELFCRDIRRWYNGNSLLPRVTRTFEHLGFDLEALYIYLNQPAKEEVTESAASEIIVEQVSEGALVVVDKTSSHSEKEKLRQTKDDKKAKEPDSFFGRLGQSIREFTTSTLPNVLKDLAIVQLHQALSSLIFEELGERFIQIYGARFPQAAFVAQQQQQEVAHNILILGHELELLEKLLSHLLDERYPTSFDPAQKSSFSIDFFGDKKHHFFLYRWNASATNGQEKRLKELLRARTFHCILLVEEIDYGARRHSVEEIREQLLPELRKSQIGTIGLVLVGVEKLKPLKWQPPYDDYRDEHPKRRKSQRIRNGILAWQEAFEEVVSIDMERIFPVAFSQDGETWGLEPLGKFLNIPTTTVIPQRTSLELASQQPQLED